MVEKDFNYKKIGVIGGMGPTTSLHFYEMIIHRFQARKGARFNYEFPEMVIHNVPSPDNVADGVGDSLLPYLLKSCALLEQAGVDFITLPCNSAHVYIEALTRAAKVPVLNILKETVKAVRTHNLKRVLVLGTWSTLRHRLYDAQLEKASVGYILPDDQDRQVLTDMILQVCDGSVDQNTKTQMAQLIGGYPDADSVILGCTELPQVVPPDLSLPVFDSLEVLADATFDFCVA